MVNLQFYSLYSQYTVINCRAGAPNYHCIILDILQLTRKYINIDK